MNNEESEQDLQRRLQELEVSIPTSDRSVTTQTNPSNDAARVNKFVNLFQSLPTTGKLIAVGVGVIVGFAILKSLLSLLAALFSLAFLGLVGYFAYQFLIARSSQK